MTQCATRVSLAALGLGLTFLFGCDGAPAVEGPDGAAPPIDGAPPSDAARPDGSAGDARIDDPDAGPRVPTRVPGGPCDANGTCAWPETANTCPEDCGSYEIATYTAQTAKYVDASCPMDGDGLTDTCASSPGGPGRMNRLRNALTRVGGGDTLYIHPGTYYEAPESGSSPTGGIFVVATGSLSPAPSAERPLIITARDPASPPVLRSFEGASGTRAGSSPALIINGAHVIVDHLSFDGQVSVSGGRSVRVQWSTCTFGWGVCDGNWACIHVGDSEDVVVHHNLVHDVDLGVSCPGGDDRGAGLKEFTSERTIWEFNTIRNVPRWGFDHHRNSIDSSVRYNVFSNVREGIRSERGTRNHYFGNVVAGRDNCFWTIGVNERYPDTPHTDDIYNNTCLFAGWGIAMLDSNHENRVENNVFHRLGEGGGAPGDGVNNIVAVGGAHDVDHNGYDADANYRREPYDGPNHMELSTWQSASGWDAASTEGANGACALVDPPTAVDDESFDARVAEGPCRTASGTGGELGPYGLASCVGHLCPPP